MYFLISLARVRCDRERGGDAAGGFCDSEGRASCTCQSEGMARRAASGRDLARHRRCGRESCPCPWNEAADPVCTVRSSELREVRGLPPQNDLLQIIPTSIKKQPLIKKCVILSRPSARARRAIRTGWFQEY